MKFERIGKPEIIQSCPNPLISYFAWPSSARLQDGRIAVVSSGYRTAHHSPDGRLAISYSDDDGKSFTRPAILPATLLDNRDPGIVSFGESSVFLSYFATGLESLRSILKDPVFGEYRDYFAAILNKIPEEADADAGSRYLISHDCGKTFVHGGTSPVFAPHGPAVLKDGSLLYVGSICSGADTAGTVAAFHISEDGVFEERGTVAGIADAKGPFSCCEPHALQLPDGTVLCHIRVERGNERETFTTYQTESKDEGRTWSTPRRILDVLGGATSHLLLHSSGVLISTCEYRRPPFEIRVMFSEDLGKTWNTGNVLYSRGLTENYDIYGDNDYPANDLGYATTVELKNGDLMSFFYSRHPDLNSPAQVLAQKWRLSR